MSEKLKTLILVGLKDLLDRVVKLGREAGGLNLCLDADESLSNNFVKIADQVFPQLQPGHKVSMQWLALWKSILIIEMMQLNGVIILKIWLLLIIIIELQL